MATKLEKILAAKTLPDLNASTPATRRATKRRRAELAAHLATPSDMPHAERVMAFCEAR